MFGTWYDSDKGSYGLVEELASVLSEERVKTNVPLSSLTTFRIGGPADVVVTPANVKELRKVLSIVSDRDAKMIVIGRGSNILASDQGFRGVVIRIGEAMQQLSRQGNILVVGCGNSLNSVARYAEKNGLGGLEFAAGIPGAVGGGLYMNAGAYGGEMKDVLQEVTVMDRTGEIRHLDLQDMEMGYRSSILQRKSWIAVECVLQLEERDPLAIKTLTRKFNQQRKEKQPLEYPSAGSMFKRPENYFAGALIEQAGLKGYSVGGACVSEKHAGFVINKGGATCNDVLELIRQVQSRVYENSGVMLEPEVRYLSARGLDSIH